MTIFFQEVLTFSSEAIFGQIWKSHLHQFTSVYINLHQCENIGWRYINNRSDATSQYIFQQKMTFSNGVVTCVVVMKCEWKLNVIYINIDQFTSIFFTWFFFRSKETWDSNEAFFGQTWCHGQFWKPYLHQRKVHWFWWVEYDQWQV